MSRYIKYGKAATRAHLEGQFYEVLPLLGGSIKDLMTHLEGLWFPGMSWSNYNSVWFADYRWPRYSWTQHATRVPEMYHYRNILPHWTDDARLMLPSLVAAGDRWPGRPDTRHRTAKLHGARRLAKSIVASWKENPTG